MNLIDELTQFYYDYETYHETKLSQKEARAYFQVALEKDRIRHISVSLGGREQLIGYVESWRLDYDHFGRVLCGERFNIRTEDIERGPIAFVANTCVHPDFRMGKTIHDLKWLFVLHNYDAKYFCGEARHNRRSQPLKIFPREKVLRAIGVFNG